MCFLCTVDLHTSLSTMYILKGCHANATERCLITERFYVSVNKTNVLRSSRKVTGCFSNFNQIRIFQTGFNKSIRYKYHKIPSRSRPADICGGTGGYDEAKRPYTKAPKILYESFPVEFPYGASFEKKSAEYAFRLR